VGKRFNGVINLDVRDSVADWGPFMAPEAPEGAPNVLIVLYDDTGLAAWSPFGGRIEMPTLQRLADNGLTYSQGVSMRYSFDEADAPTAKKVQYYEMMGTRGLWSDGWKAVAERGPMIGTGNFENDTWQLFHTDEDRSEAHDLADRHPDKVKQLVDLWHVEAGKYDVLPLDDRSLAELVAVQPEAMIPPGGIYKYYPGTLEIPEFAAANTRGRSYKILARSRSPTLTRTG